MLITPSPETVFLSFLDKVPNSIVYYTPIFTEQDEAPADFQIAYCNEVAAREGMSTIDGLVGLKTADLVGKVPQTSELLLKQLSEVYASGKEVENVFFNPRLDKFFRVTRTRVGGGVLSVSNNITAEVRERQERDKQKRLSELMLENSLNAWYIIEAVTDDEGGIKDFIFRQINRHYTKLIGLSEPEVIGQSIKTLFPAVEQHGLFDIYCEVLQNGVSQNQQMHYQGDGLNAWYDVVVSKLDNVSLLSTFADFTQYQLALQELQRKTDLLDSIMAHSPSGIAYGRMIRDEKGKIIDSQPLVANDRAFEVSGIPKELFLGKTSVELEPKILESEYFRKVIHTMTTGEPGLVEYEVESSGKWIEVSFSRMDEDHLIIVFSDISERKRNLAEIEQKTALLDNILLYSANGISVSRVIRDDSRTVVDANTILANEAAIRFIGLPKEDYLNKTAVELEPNIRQSPYFKMCVRTLETGEPSFVQYPLESTGRWLEISVSRMDSEHLITIFTDITPGKEAQLRQDRLVQELQKSNKNLEEFTRAASHDLKEPIRKVQYFVDRLQDTMKDGLTEDQARLLGRVVKATARMRLLVDDLLDYAHLDSDHQEQEEVDLNEKLNTILSDVEVLLQEKGAIVLADSLPVIKAYPRQIEQVFQNLLSNALKYTRKDMVPKISIQFQEVQGAASGFALPADRGHEKFYHIEIRDNGIGFEAEDAERIFQVFTRLHGNVEYSGTGIGLSIVKKAMDNHRGFVYAEGMPGEGACFHLLFPVEPALGL